MNRILIFLAITICILAQKRLYWSSTSSSVVYPNNANAVYVTKLNDPVYGYDDLIPGSKWIWDNNGLNSPQGDRFEVEIKFYARCTGDMILHIAAYGNWWVYLDGSLMKQGNGHQEE